MTIPINKYVLYSLLILLASLTAYQMGVLGFLLFLSVIVNFFLLRKLLRQQDTNEELHDDLYDLYYDVDSLGEHLEELNQMHIYHGDENIFKLIHHTREVQDHLIDFQVKYSTGPVTVINEEGEEYKTEYGDEDDDDGSSEEEKEEEQLFYKRS